MRSFSHTCQLSVRKGATLTECLVAIFIMGIGLLALLTLFPLGALNMAQAIKDTRCAEAASNAFAIAETNNLKADAAIYDPANGVDFFTSPPGFGPLPDLQGPSYPVYVDAIGERYWLTNGAGPGEPEPVQNPFRFSMPRSSGRLGGTGFLTLKWFTSHDDIEFGDDALPKAGTTGNINRNTVYSWSYLLQRPKASDPTVVNLAVAVYQKRPLFGAYYEASFPTTFVAGSKSVSIPSVGTHRKISGPPPPQPELITADLRKGQWILDATPWQADTATPAHPHAAFYRVVEVTVDPVNAGQVNLELQTPITGNSLPNQGVLVIMENVAEVFAARPVKK